MDFRQLPFGRDQPAAGTGGLGRSGGHAQRRECTASEDEPDHRCGDTWAEAGRNVASQFIVIDCANCGLPLAKIGYHRDRHGRTIALPQFRDHLLDFGVVDP